MSDNMSDKGQKAQHEPSMEEILASIRQIISEDEPRESVRASQSAPPGGTESHATPSGGTAQGGAEEVFDLTRMVNEDGSVTDLREESMPPEQAARPTPPDRPERAAPSDHAERPAPMHPMARAEREGDEAEPEAEAELISPDSAAEAREAFRNLYGSTRLRREGGPDTLEDLVADLLRPMLKEWLDAHLPALVEELVEKEIARLSRRRRD